LSRVDYKKPDYWARRAKEAGFAARSVFKLEEIDRAERLLRPGFRVLDLGAAPGSWMQYACERVKKKGLVVGVDKRPLERALSDNERFIEADVFELEPEEALAEAEWYHVVISDMAPNTIGHKASDHYRSMALAERALWLVGSVLGRGGAFLVKVFQGADFEAYRAMLRERFNKVKIKKPGSSRKSSREIYLLGLGRKRHKKEDY